MPDKYQNGPLAFVILGAIILLIFAGLIWDSSAILTEQRVRYQEASRSYSEQATDRIERNCMGDLSDAVVRECIRAEMEAADERKRAERDLEAQESMARFTRLMGITGLIGLIVGVGSVYLIWATLKATQTMANEAADIGVKQLRPWMLPGNLVIIPETMGIDKTGERIPILIFFPVWENKGQSPAINLGLTVSYKIVPVGSNIDDFESNERFGSVIVGPGGSIESQRDTIFGPLRQDLLDQKRDLIVYTRVDYAFSNNPLKAGTSEARYRCRRNGDKYSQAEKKMIPNFDIFPDGNQSAAT